MPVDLNERLEHALDVDRTYPESGVPYADTHHVGVDIA